jgi:alpha-L-rhamnosidase
MIAADAEFNGAPLLRVEFDLDPLHGPITRATLNLSAFGIVEGWLNGRPVSGELLTPGWSSYEWRLRYAAYDVTELLGARGADGPASVLGLALGNGWFRGRLGWSGRSRFYGDELGALAQLEIEYQDRHVQIVSTDESWSAGPSAVLANDLYDG